MRYLLIALLAACNPFGMSAQTHNIFADVSPFAAGLSATYNYKATKHFGGGAGFQSYNYSPTLPVRHRFTPALFADLRLYMRPGKKNQFFSFLDLGINFYSADGMSFRSGTIIYKNTEGNGFYAGLGFGYFRRITRRGGGPYASLKIISNTYRPEGFDLATHEQFKGGWLSGTLCLSVGFRFGNGPESESNKRM